MEVAEQSVALNSGDDRSVQVLASASVIVSIDYDAAPGKSDSIAKVALRQAEERTKLVVECASLAKRMAQLDEETAQYPAAHHADRVQLRFEEARQREAAAARRGRGHAAALLDLVDAHVPTSPRSPRSPWSPRTPSGAAGLWDAPRGHVPTSPRSPRSPRTPSGVVQVTVSNNGAELQEERKDAAACLAEALQAANFEASIWRQRACEVSREGARERERALRLMQFDLHSALRGAEEERGRLSARAPEQEAAVARARADLEASEAALVLARRRGDQHEAACVEQMVQCEALTRAAAEQDRDLAARDEKLAALRLELRDCRGSDEARLEELLEARARGERLGADLDGLRAELQASRAEGQDGEARCRQLAGALERAEGELREAAAQREAARRELQETRADGGARSSRLVRELAGVRSELDAALEQAESLRARGHRAEAELAGVRGELGTALEHAESLRARGRRAEAELLRLRAERDLHAQEAEAAREERDAKVSTARTARWQAELLSAQVDNMQAALDSSNNKQADLAMEREVLRVRTRRLESALGSDGPLSLSPTWSRDGSPFASAAPCLTLPISTRGSTGASTGWPQSAEPASPEASSVLLSSPTGTGAPQLPVVGPAPPTRSLVGDPSPSRSHAGDPGPGSAGLSPLLKSLPPVRRPQSSRGPRKD